MGFKKRTIYRLVFDDPELEGLTVSVRRGSVQERLDYDLIDDWRERLTYFTRFLVDWNLIDDADQVRPLTAESLFAEEDDVVQAIIRAWLTHGREVSGPLVQPSTGGMPTSDPGPGRDLELESSMAMSSPAA